MVSSWEYTCSFHTFRHLRACHRRIRSFHHHTRECHHRIHSFRRHIRSFHHHTRNYHCHIRSFHHHSQSCRHHIHIRNHRQRRSCPSTDCHRKRHSGCRMEVRSHQHICHLSRRHFGTLQTYFGPIAYHMTRRCMGSRTHRSRSSMMHVWHT